MEADADLISISRRFDELNCVQIESIGRERKLVLSKAVVPSQVILLIPPKSLLNVKTIDKYLDSRILPSTGNTSHLSNWKSTVVDVAEARTPLTSVQSLTFLLASWRSLKRLRATQISRDLDEVLSTVPKSYPSFPIVWKLASEQSNYGRAAPLGHLYRALLDSLPHHIAQLCEQVYLRYVKDCDAIRSIEQYEPEMCTFDGIKMNRLEEPDLLWAWCGVNSRCVYLPLGLKPSKENFTLAPLLDMANHTMETRLECKVKWTSSGGLQLTAPAKTYEPRGLSIGQEVMIAYGPHSNGTLLSEYGFTLCLSRYKDTSKEEWRGNPFAEINVDQEVFLILSKDAKDGTRKVKLLRDAGYYGLVIALRLLAIQNLDVQDLQAWRDIISGGRDDISDANEAAAKKLLLKMCNHIIKDRKWRIEKLLTAAQEMPTLLSDEDANDTKDVKANLDMVKELLEEEIFIAQLMKNALLKGCTYW